MSVLVGIDEAGFGPILGPLVVSSSTFRVPRERLKEDLWQQLHRSLGSRRRHLAGRLLVCDSKKAYTRSSGLRHLERTVRACLLSLDRRPETLAELLCLLSPSCVERLADYPWYADIRDRRLSEIATDLQIAASVFQDDMKAHDIRLLALAGDCIDVAHYNRMVDSVRNKASVLFTSTAGLIKQAFDQYGRDDLQIVVDRQGGRTRYRDVLQRMFPGTELRILLEDSTNSSYELTAPNKAMRIHFRVAADQTQLPVALASMVSKYVRELMIGCLNDYFRTFSTDLQPTAGYWTDGLRFIKDIQAHLTELNVDQARLVRVR